MRFQILFSIVLLFAFFNSAFGQLNDAVKWGEKYEEDGYYKFLGETEEAIFAERKYDSRYNDRSAEIELIRYDKLGELTHAVEVRDLEEGSYASMGSFDTPEGIAHLYFQTTKDKKQIISAQIFNHQELKKTVIVDLATFKIKTSANQRVTDMGLEVSNDIYPLDYVLSSDNSKLGVFYTQEKVGKIKETYYQYAVFDLNTGFQLMHSGNFYSDDKSNKFMINDLDLGNKGDLNYLLKHYVKNTDTEFINKKPAYSYEIYHLTGDSTEYIYDIKTKKVFIDKLKLGSDDDGGVYVAGFLRERPFGKITSSYLLSLDPLGNRIAESKDKYRRKEIEEMQGKAKDELDGNFQIIDVVVGSDMVYLIKQYIKRNTRNINNGFNNGVGLGRRNTTFNDIDIDWDFDEVVVEGVGKNTGEIQWITTNRRNQNDNSQIIRYFIRGSYHLHEGNLYLFYNERLDNIERLEKDEKIKGTDVPGDTTMPMIAKINKEGKLTYRFLNGEKKYHVPNTGVFIGENNIYIINQKRNFDEFMLGISDLKLLDF